MIQSIPFIYKPWNSLCKMIQVPRQREQYLYTEITAHKSSELVLLGYDVSISDDIEDVDV